jgi:hypothetical protein
MNEAIQGELKHCNYRKATRADTAASGMNSFKPFYAKISV